MQNPCGSTVSESSVTYKFILTLSHKDVELSNVILKLHQGDLKGKRFFYLWR